MSTRAGQLQALEGLGRFYWHTAPPPTQGLVIGYAKPPQHAFAAALDALTGMLAELYPGLAEPHRRASRRGGR